jgi:hypothetical protein
VAAAAADALRNADIRQWARDNGFTVGDAGRMPAGVQAAYEAAHAGEQDDDDGGGPDWNAGAQALGVALGVAPADPLADDASGDNDLDGGGDSPGSTGAAQGPRPAVESTLNGPPAAQPVTSLADARARMNAQQPKRPGWAGKPAQDRARGGKAAGKGATARGKPAPAPDTPDIEVTPAVLNDMAGKLGLLVAPLLFTWSLADPDNCADIASEHAENIIDKLVPLLARSPAVVRFMTIDAGWFALVALVQAVQPVAVAVYRNHLTAEAREYRSPEAKQQRAAQAAQQRAAQPDLSDYVVNPVVRGHVPAYRPA